MVLFWYNKILGESMMKKFLETGKIVMEGNAKDLANDDRVKKAYLGA